MAYLHPASIAWRLIPHTLSVFVNVLTGLPAKGFSALWAAHQAASLWKHRTVATAAHSRSMASPTTQPPPQLLVYDVAHGRQAVLRAAIRRRACLGFHHGAASSARAGDGSGERVPCNPAPGYDLHAVTMVPTPYTCASRCTTSAFGALISRVGVVALRTRDRLC